MKTVKICVDKLTSVDISHLKKLKTISPSAKDYYKLRAAFYTSKLWPNNHILKIAFLEDPKDIERTTIEDFKQKREDISLLDPLQYKVENMDIKNAIKLIVNERIAPITNLKYIFTENFSEATIRITFDSIQGAWSLLGTDCLTEKDPKVATMNLGWFDVPTTIHEFCHALSMVHEHQNPDGNTIDWDEEKVYKWAAVAQKWNKETTFTNIIQKYKAEQINGSKYDPKSIMLYFFPGSLTKSGNGTHENLRLSEYDVQYLNSMYPNSPKTASEFYMEVYKQKIENIAPFPRENVNLDNLKITDKKEVKAAKNTKIDNDIHIAPEIFSAFLITIGILCIIIIIAKFLLPKKTIKIEFK